MFTFWNSELIPYYKNPDQTKNWENKKEKAIY